jgi:hypothetical protein
LEQAQKLILRRLAMVGCVIVFLIVAVYFVFKPTGKSVASNNRFPDLQAQKTAVPALFRGGHWLIDPKASGAWDGLSSFALGDAGDVPLAGFWANGAGASMGVYKDAKFSLLLGGNIRVFGFGNSDSLPVVGDWTGDGRTKIGTYSKGFWQLDLNGNGRWDDQPTDRFIALGGTAGEIPVTGDWNGDGRTKVGVYTTDGSFHLDLDGNGVWDQNDKIIYLGQKGDIPVIGDWNGDGRSKVGVFRSGLWILDYNGNGKWDGSPTDRIIALGGVSGEVPVIGDWNGDGKAKAGVYQPPGVFHLDFDGNGVWDQRDKELFLGAVGDVPVVLNPVHHNKK